MGVELKEGENMDVNHELDLSGFESFGSSFSSSDLSTLVGSELDSTEVESTDEDDDEFMAELTRQMADYMLQEEEDDGEKKNLVSNFDSANLKENDGKGIIKDTNSVNLSSVKESSNTVGNHSSSVFPADQMQPIQYYQLENQPRVGNGRRGKRRDSIQPEKQINKIGGLSSKYGKGCYPPTPYVGSGMRAVFLGGGGVGSRNQSSGTGVFLPRTITTSTDQPLKKSGCSTVLIPTRVLQALEQHFSNVNSLSPSNRNSPRDGTGDSTQEKGQPQSQSKPLRGTIDHQLPQEWTY